MKAPTGWKVKVNDRVRHHDDNGKYSLGEGTVVRVYTPKEVWVLIRVRRGQEWLVSSRSLTVLKTPKKARTRKKVDSAKVNRKRLS